MASKVRLLLETPSGVWAGAQVVAQLRYINGFDPMPLPPGLQSLPRWQQAQRLFEMARQPGRLRIFRERPKSRKTRYILLRQDNGMHPARRPVPPPLQLRAGRRGVDLTITRTAASLAERLRQQGPVPATAETAAMSLTWSTVPDTFDQSLDQIATNQISTTGSSF